MLLFSSCKFKLAIYSDYEWIWAKMTINSYWFLNLNLYIEGILEGFPWYKFTTFFWGRPGCGREFHPLVNNITRSPGGFARQVDILPLRPLIIDGSSLVFPLNKRNSMIFPWFSHDFSMIFPWFFHDFPTIFPWFFHDFSMIFPRFFHDFSMIFPWFSHDFSMIFPWCPWFFHDFHGPFGKFEKVVKEDLTPSNIFQVVEESKIWGFDFYPEIWGDDPIWQNILVWNHQLE